MEQCEPHSCDSEHVARMACALLCTRVGIALRVRPAGSTRCVRAVLLEALMVRQMETIVARTCSHVRRTSAVALSVALGGIIAGGCIDPESPLIERSAEGCDEFVVGQD